MSLTLSAALRSSMADRVTALLDAGAAAAYIEIRSGSRPAGPGTAASGTLLATFDLNDPSFGAASSGVITLDVTPALTTTGLAAATATWCRFYDSNDVAVVDGKVGASGSGADIELNTTTISVGVNLEITSGTITMPAGTAD